MDKDLADLVGFYQRELAETEAGRKLLERLELDSPEAVEHFGLGYASGLAAKVASASQLERLRALGLVRGRRYELLSRCLVIPVYDADGELVDLCGIRAYASQAKYVHWQPEHRGLIGAAALGTHTEVVLCDAPLQALHVRRHGHANVVALRGAGELAGHLELFRKSGLKRVYLVSRKCRAELASRLKAAGIKVEVVPYPSQAAVVPAESLRAVMPEPVGGEGADLELVGRTDQYVSFAAGGVAYRLEAAGPTGVSLRSVVKAERAGRSHMDRLDLASAAARRKYARGCAARLRVSSAAVEGHLAAMAERVEKLDAAQAGGVPGGAELTAAEREVGLGLLKGEDVLELLSGAMERHFRLIGEEANRKLAVLVAASRLLPQPLGAIVRGPAGSGKSAVLRAVGRMLPAGAVLNLTRMTPQALYWMPHGQLEHRVLIVDEYEGLEGAEHSLRTMMSSQSLSLAITVREGGRLPVTRTVEIPARLAVLVSTTQPVNVENLSRFLELRMDDSPEQTRRVMGALAAGREPARRGREVDLAVLRAMNALLEPCIVEVPFTSRLVYSSSNVLARRQFEKVVGLISAHAALSQHQRQTRRDGGGRLTVQAEKRDYAAVHPLLGHVVEHFEEDVSPAALQLLEGLTAREERTFTRKDVMERCGWSYSKTHRTLKELESLDLVVPDSTTNGVMRFYEAAPYFRGERGVSQIAPPEAV